ncbi:PAS domain-containing protein [Hymenobacter crusticola]|uniref:histidine kinase n=1 Tax=Hymenobacter crusticola TaxID=1770526 RepID=A0A243W9G3_9BACT|nr:PAS domain-containing protein [Hymenobacter crusticola]OUJ72171.1 hypothetical protein BXP70_19475 [Hymenobacter crusticola]
MSPSSVGFPADLVASHELLHSLLAVSLTGIILFRPVYAAGESGELVDLAYVQLNPAAQRMLRLPAQPVETFRTLYPNSLDTGIFAFYRDTFLSDQPGQYEVNYSYDGLDNFFLLSAQRSGELLLVSFSDTAEQQSVAAEALRRSQAREQAARAEAEAQRAELQRIFAQAPIALARLRGPAFVVELANTRMGQIWGRPLDQIIGRPHFEALPDLVGQGFEAVFAGVLQTGEPYYFRELLVHIEQAHQPYQGYFNISYQPAYDELGHITGLIASAIEVTDQVRARQQVQALNEELAAINEELYVSNEEYLTANATLGETQQQLRQLNQELEERVAERTQAALALQADMLAAAQRQVAEREAFYEVFEQAPAAVALLRSPGHRFEYVNPAYQQLFAGRPLVGLDYVTALPEAVAQGFDKLLDQVYQTGETFFGDELPFTPTPAVGQLPRTIYFNFTFQAYREAGQIAGISIFAFDVTEQVLARQEREAQQRLLTNVFEQAPIGIAIQSGPDFVYEFHNASYQWMVPDRQLVGRRFFDVFPEMAATNVETLLRHVYKTGETQQEQELLVPVARADGSAELEDRYFTIVYQARRDEQGGINGILAFVMEVTEQVQARQQVQTLNEELAAINEELTATNEDLNESNTQLTRTNVDLDTFVYTASHDLKAPITNIESIGLALRDTLPAAVQQDALVTHLLGLFDTTVARFRFTIGQLTDISRLQLAHAGPAEPVVLAAVVENIRLDLAPVLAEAGTQLTVEVAPDLVVSFSPANLRSIVYNLLSNAVKYRALDRPSVVQVRAEPGPTAVVFTVQDNGLGMSVLQQRQLFGLFQRLHTHVEGTGVGLYITKRLLENGGGTIAVASQPNVGTTFTVTFPI